MLEYVTITSQGQISIPAKFRRLLGLNVSSKATVELEKGKLIIRPAKSLMELDGVIKDKALSYTPEKIRKIEKTAWSKAARDKFSPK
jgi:AbrB family looped-hinge helix DNA binding protein